MTRKRLMLGGASAAALVLASSAAFACLTPKGQITVTGSSLAGDTVKAIDNPVHAGFCTNPMVAAEAATNGGRVTVAVAPSTCVSTQTRLTTGTAAVVLQFDNTKPGWSRLDDTSPWTWVANNGCFGPSGPASVQLGTFSISNGSASGGFNFPATVNMKANEDKAGHICVKDANSDGAFAPFRII